LGATDKYRGGRHLEAIGLIKDLTGVEKAVLHEIASRIDFRDFSSSRYMSLAEIADGTSFAKSSCMRAVNALVSKGYIRRQNQAGSIKNLPNSYWILDHVFDEIESLDNKQPELDGGGYTHSGTPIPTVGMGIPTVTMGGYTHSGTPIPTVSMGIPTVGMGIPTVTMGYTHSDDEDPKHPKNPKNPLSISQPSPSLSAPSQPDMPTVPRVKRDFMGAIAKPSRPKPRLDLLASLVNAANRPGRDESGKAAFYPPHAEWAIAIRSCAERYSTADFDALLPYLVATNRQAQGVIAPGNLDKFLSESAAYAANPSSLKAQENQSMASYAEYMAKIGKPKENTEVDWVTTLDIHELKSRLTDDKFPASKETYDRLLKRYLDLGGIYGDLGGKTPKLVPSR